MSRWVILSAAADSAAVAADLAGTDGLRHCSGDVDLPGSTGGHGATWDLAGDLDPGVVAARLPGPVDVVTLSPVETRVVPLGQRRRVKRTLLLTVRPGTHAAVVKRFEVDLMTMPAHIGSIKSWSLSRVSGRSRWTHVWEQEFADIDGLNGEYLLHPYHWTHVDRWFDAEIPGSIVEPAIAHLYRWADGPVLGN